MAGRLVHSAVHTNALSADSAALSADPDSISLWTRELWHEEGIPSAWQQNWLQFEETSKGNEWAFWARWYRGVLDGESLDWELQRKIAVIPEDDWKKGAAHIARIIADLEAEQTASLTAGTVEQNPSSQRLTLVPQPAAETQQLGYLIDSIEAALELSTSDLGNGLPVDAYQARLLRRSLGRHGNDPQRLEMDFERARVSLIGDIAADSIPSSAANRDLIQCLDDAGRAIRDSNPDISKNRDRLNRLRLEAVSLEDAAQIADAAEQVAEISEGELREGLLENRYSLPGVRRDDPVPDAILPIGVAERNIALEVRDGQIWLYSNLTKVLLYLKAMNREELSRLLDTPEAKLISLLSGVVGTIIAVVTLL